MKPEETVSLKEIAGVIRSVAADNEWRRGRREFQTVKKNLFGFQLEVRNKNNKLSLKKDGWIIRLDLHRLYDDYMYGSNPEEEIFTLPSFSGKWPKIKAVVMKAFVIKGVSFEIESEDAFVRDWSLLKMFASEFENAN